MLYKQLRVLIWKEVISQYCFFSIVPLWDTRKWHTTKCQLEIFSNSSAFYCLENMKIFFYFIYTIYLFYNLTAVSPFSSSPCFSPQTSFCLSPIHSSSISIQKMTDLTWISIKHGIPSCSRLSTLPCIKVGQGNPIWGIQSQSQQNSQRQTLFPELAVPQGASYTPVTYVQRAQSIPCRIPGCWVSLCELLSSS